MNYMGERVYMSKEQMEAWLSEQAAEATSRGKVLVATTAGAPLGMLRLVETDPPEGE